MIAKVGELVGNPDNARNLISGIRLNFSNFQISNPKYQAVYLIWKDPYMTIGGDTFISDMMNRCGFQNIFESRTRYPEITLEQLIRQPAYRTGRLPAAQEGCQLLLLSSEPYPSKKSIEKNCNCNYLT
jgi:hypothetical protein